MRVFKPRQALLLSEGLKSRGLPSIYEYLINKGRIANPEKTDPYAEYQFQKHVASTSRTSSRPSVLSLFETPEKNNDRLTFKFKNGGNLTSETADMHNFMSDLMQYIDKEKYIVFDLKNMHNLDKEGFGRFISIHKRLNEKGKQLILTNLEAGVMEKFELMKLDKLFSIIEDYRNVPNIIASSKLLVLKQNLEKPRPPLESRNRQTIEIKKLEQHSVYVIKFKDYSKEYPEKFLDRPEFMDYSTLRAELKALSAEGKKFVFDLPDKFGYGSFLNSFAPTISEILKEINELFKEGGSVFLVRCKNDEARYKLKENDLITDESYTGAVLRAVSTPPNTTQWSPAI